MSLSSLEWLRRSAGVIELRGQKFTSCVTRLWAVDSLDQLLDVNGKERESARERGVTERRGELRAGE